MAHADREPSAAASRSDNPDAWVSGGHEKFETPVVPVRDGEHPAAAPVRCACCGTEKPKHGPCPSCGFGWNAPAVAPNSYPVGRRLPDLRFGEIHTDIRPGDYWKILNDEDGTPRLVRAEGKLTETCWYVVVPLGSKRGYGLGRLEKHTVREHEDGSITVAPGDGSSNSILVTKGAGGPSWHGYIERGVFREA